MWQVSASDAIALDVTTEEDPMPYEFKFVVDGELDAQTQAAIAQAVAEAGSAALGQAIKPDRDFVAIDLSHYRKWEWLGRYLALDARAEEIAGSLAGVIRR
jgi:hypothetical protein